MALSYLSLSLSLYCFVFLILPLLVSKFNTDADPPSKPTSSFVRRDEGFYLDSANLVLGPDAQWGLSGSNFTERHRFTSAGVGPRACDLGACYVETRRRLWLPEASRVTQVPTSLGRDFIKFSIDDQKFPAVPLAKLDEDLPRLLALACDGCAIRPPKAYRHAGNISDVAWKPIVLEITAADLNHPPYNRTKAFYFNLLLANFELDAIYFGLA